MKLRESENCGQFSNISTKRSGNISRQSTCRGRTTFSTQSSCFSSPKNIHAATLSRTNSSYSKIHLNLKGSIEESEPPLIRKETQEVTESAVKIQRFWRFHLLMRRRVQEKIISNLQKDTELWELALHNCRVQSEMVSRRIKKITRESQQQSLASLGQVKEQMKQFTQSSIKKQMSLMNAVSRIRKQIQYYNNTTSTIKESIEEQQSIINKLLANQQYFKEREESHISIINRLNKDLILLNMEKSRMQLEVDQIRCQIQEGGIEE